MHNVISIISQKGGVGKSTVTTLLANIFHFHFKHSVAIIDADYPQNSIGKKRDVELLQVDKKPHLKKVYDFLYREQKPYPIYKTDLVVCSEKIREIKGDYDYVFADVTGSINQAGISEFLNEVNHFFLPVLQDDYSVRSAAEIYGIVDGKVRMLSTEFRSCQLFFNRIPPKNQVKAIKEDMGNKYRVLEKYLGSYRAYEKKYRSTLYPIPQKDENPSLKVYEFASAVKASIASYNESLVLTP